MFSVGPDFQFIASDIIEFFLPESNSVVFSVGPDFQFIVSDIIEFFLPESNFFDYTVETYCTLHLFMYRPIKTCLTCLTRMASKVTSMRRVKAL